MKKNTQSSSKKSGKKSKQLIAALDQKVKDMPPQEKIDFILAQLD